MSFAAVRAARLAASLVLVLSCAHRPSEPPRAAPATATGTGTGTGTGTEPEPEPEPAATPAAPAPPAPPDRTQPPWSQTRVPPIAAGAVAWDRAAGGRHARLGTARGSVHVWLPAGYRPRGAAIVLYVHGYYTDVDQAFVDHHLAAQLRASGLNALFVAAEAPSWNGEEVQWPDLAALLKEVHARTGLTLPRGPVAVAGHSGAIRTILPWLAHPRVEEVFLLDATYRGEPELWEWLAAAPRGRRRLVLVGDETAARSEALLDVLPDAVRRPKVPAEPGEGDRRARAVYYRSQFDHMAIVEQGRVLPAVLRGSRLPRL